MNGNDSQKKKSDEFYKNFKTHLTENHIFPGNYTFKFIVPSDNKRMAELQKIFDNVRPQFQTKSSKNNKYTSLTVVIYAIDADQIIAYYKEASNVENVIML